MALITPFEPYTVQSPRHLIHSDYGNYGPLLIRLAWHCSGTFRNTDGRGGCSGGRIRFDPERSWEDNTNLDKARRLLGPIKEKYGLGLSWGDLFVAVGTTAIEEMGGPTLGLCFGRVDEEDGSRSAGLDQCPPGSENGDCKAPMGATTMNLIYVNPEGPMAQPIPDQSALQVRDTFSRMGMDDRETVALIGGGHSFGKTHGPCVEDHAAGDSPKVTLEAGMDPETQAWQGKCGTGVGADAWTSGFEGPWTANPVQWDNSYFTILQSNEWANATGPGGKTQWYSSTDPDLMGMGAFDEPEKIMMLTSDVALLQDPEGQYQTIVAEFAEDPAALDEAFAAAWHKLTTSNFGNGTPRCTGALPVEREGVTPEPAPVDEPEPAPVDEPEPAPVDAPAATEKPVSAGHGAFGLPGTAVHLLFAYAVLTYVL